MPLRRLPSRALIVLVVLACSAIVPATAHAAVIDAVETAAGTAAPAQRAGDVVRTVASRGDGGATAPPRPVTGSDSTHAARPLGDTEAPAAPRPSGGPVEQVVAPVAAASGAAAGAATGSARPAGHLREHGRARVSRITANAASAEPLNAGRSGAAAANDSMAAASRATATGDTAAAHQVTGHSASDSVARPASGRDLSAPEPTGGLAGSDGAAGGSSGFSFGGGLALLVAALLLAGPRLRRRLLLLPVVCRPAAFHVVLERPG